MKYNKFILFFSLFFGYLALAVLISDFITTFRTALLYAATVSWWKLGLSVFLTLVIASLAALNGTLLYEKYRMRRECRRETGLASAGVIGGLAVGVCPLCVGGLFPLILALFGVSFSFGVLPFSGIEIQIAVIVLLAVSLHYLRR